MLTTQNTKESQNDMINFISKLSPSFNKQVTNHIFKSAFEKNLLFKKHPEIIEKIIRNQFPKLMQPDDIVVE